MGQFRLCGVCLKTTVVKQRECYQLRGIEQKQFSDIDQKVTPQSGYLREIY